MANCNKCYKNHHNVIAEDCRICQKLAFEENILCSLLQPAHNDIGDFECFAFQPNLSVIGSVQQAETIPQESEEDSPQLSNRNKWLKAYGLQQLSINPDQVISHLSFHICLITRNREPLFSGGEIDLSSIFSEAGSQFDGHVEVLAYGKDHIHLYANSSPDYSFDDVMDKMLSSVIPKIKEEYPELFKEKDTLFEKRYFAETVG